MSGPSFYMVWDAGGPNRFEHRSYAFVVVVSGYGILKLELALKPGAWATREVILDPKADERSIMRAAEKLADAEDKQRAWVDAMPERKAAAKDHLATLNFGGDDVVTADISEPDDE